jgi:hypothetical protein
MWVQEEGLRKEAYAQVYQELSEVLNAVPAPTKPRTRRDSRWDKEAVSKTVSDDQIMADLSGLGNDNAKEDYVIASIQEEMVRVYTLPDLTAEEEAAVIDAMDAE